MPSKPDEISSSKLKDFDMDEVPKNVRHMKQSPTLVHTLLPTDETKKATFVVFGMFDSTQHFVNTASHTASLLVP